jgi:hypothetical protein
MDGRTHAPRCLCFPDMTPLFPCPLKYYCHVLNGNCVLQCRHVFVDAAVLCHTVRMQHQIYNNFGSPVFTFVPVLQYFS